jgi:hypothetical protein
VIAAVWAHNAFAVTRAPNPFEARQP